MSVFTAPEQMCQPKSMNFVRKMYVGTRIPSVEPHGLARGFSQIVTKVVENTEDDKKVKKNIKERANVHNTSAPNDNNSDEHTRKDSSDKMVLHITLKDCNVYINTPPEKE